MADFDINSPGDIFVSRDVIERWEELQGEHDSLQEAIDEAAEAHDEAVAASDEWQRELDETMESGNETAIERLESQRADHNEAIGAAREALKDAERAMEEWTDYEEYAALKSFVEEASGYGDWDHGETFIADSHFEEYAEQLAEDIGAVKRNAEWPYTCIDWKQAAEELKADYTSYEINGSTYWARS